MVTISYKGSGNAAVDSSLLGVGQGLQVGNTKIVFDKGFVQLSDSQGRQVNMGFFSSLQALSSKETTIRSFVFRAKTVCTVTIGKAVYEYNILNEWVTYNYISEQEIDISRSATGQSPDVFDWQFFASDDPKFAFTIQRANRDSESEIAFPTLSRDNVSNPQGLGAGVYAQTINLRGAKKIKVTLVTGAGAGNVTITAEYFDFASQTWISFIPATEMFNGITTGVSSQKDYGDTISKYPTPLNTYAFNTQPGGATFGTAQSQIIGEVGYVSEGGLVPPVGTVLPSGDNIFRFKAVVAGAAIAFSLGVTKVFD
ncbi:MAG: hypothetical protein ACYDAJ_02650 [Nitrosotalea sp.]